MIFRRAVGCWLLAAGCWLLAAGCWLFSAFSLQPSACSLQPSACSLLQPSACSFSLQLQLAACSWDYSMAHNQPAACSWDYSVAHNQPGSLCCCSLYSLSSIQINNVHTMLLLDALKEQCEHNVLLEHPEVTLCSHCSSRASIINIVHTLLI
jgi:hypothetical protein